MSYRMGIVVRGCQMLKSQLHIFPCEEYVGALTCVPLSQVRILLI